MLWFPEVLVKSRNLRWWIQVDLHLAIMRSLPRYMTSEFLVLDFKGNFFHNTIYLSGFIFIALIGLELWREGVDSATPLRAQKPEDEKKIPV